MANGLVIDRHALYVLAGQLESAVPQFFIALDGADHPPIGGEFASVAEARNVAVSALGGYLQEHPEYAHQGHWRVEVRDHAHRLLVHVIIATVEAAPPLNWQSFER